MINQEELGQEGLLLNYADVIVQCTEAGTVGNVTNINSPVLINPNISYVTYSETVASTAGLAGVLSLLTSVAGLPEVK